ncbi:MAG: glutamate synthase large subunit [Sediminibacterium sp.]|nr:glutamate synthase large subunit [Sediminibacterium sp.]
MYHSKNFQGLYHQRFESDACGIGFVANIKNIPQHHIVSDALTILENMEHRGACGCEENTGDGAGILIQIPHIFFKQELIKLDIDLPNCGDYGVGLIFFPKNISLQNVCKEILELGAQKLNVEILGYRTVPVDNSLIGFSALNSEPFMQQIFIKKPADINTPIDFERKLFLFKNYVSHTILSTINFGQDCKFYFCSLSLKTIIYKGQLTSSQLRSYFIDLADIRLISAFGLVHARFATNTMPNWQLAQPFRYLAHNGEINTLQGNVNWFESNEKTFYSKYFTKEELKLITPIIFENQSDSACLDNVVEFLTLCGRPLSQVMMMLIPEAWDGNELMDKERKAFYEFHASLMEPWDGPASISFTDGNIIGATLDRNGLRPSRFVVTNDDRVILSSETGVLPIPPETVVQTGRLQPGKMFIVDLQKGKIIPDAELKAEICHQKPYSQWLDKYKIRLENLDQPRISFTELSNEQILKYQKCFGYTIEDIEDIIIPMAKDAQEPIGSMGSDTPLAILSHKPQHITSYFKQLFAQVTNPPIDPIREKLVMSLASYVGGLGNLLEENEMDCKTLALPHPILNNLELEKVRSIDLQEFQTKTLQSYFIADGKPDSLLKGLDRICRYAVDAINDNFKIIILSDRAIDSQHAPIPSLLACSAIHHHLINKGLRGQVGIIVEAGDVWEVHHIACLIGFGATAINPYLALSSINRHLNTNEISQSTSIEKFHQNYIKAINYGLLKIFSKMGISTLQSYQGAQIFEILGINNKVVDNYFTGCISRIGGIGLEDLAREVLMKHSLAFGSPYSEVPDNGIYQWKRRGEFHLFNPQTIHLLQLSTKQNDYNTYKKYAALINDQSEKACTLRSLFELVSDRPAISIDEVEPAENIYKRFATGAMSFGSISWEAHTTLALAMNRLGGKSNTGEGGEDEIRYQPLPNGDSMKSAIKQVASGRFGVTSYYLTEADELQIKIAQGAKPGEGGQLPGYKVDDWIGKTRHAVPGVGLISPPPHHDIYSIEDLAQLIFDLKNANRQARINVKLVSKAGVGTIAAGVTKAKADVVLISGFDGGTGASPLSSIKHAGLSWELGVAETQQTLVKNKLRSRVVVQTDGQLRTGKDIAIATLLGAEEWGIATAALIVEGCIMMRKCHLNSCPVGVATQDPDLRKRFNGQVEHVINFFKFITADLREIMAELGFKTIDEMVGQTHILQTRKNLTHWKTKKIDLSALLNPELFELSQSRFHNESQHHFIDDILDRKLINDSLKAIQNRSHFKAEYNILNTHRAVGTMLSNEISKLYKSEGLKDDSLFFKFNGTAGQSFGAFMTKGISFELEGDANDYVGKGLCGGKLIIYPNKKIHFDPKENSIIGNVSFYGATSGQAYILGKAGERFAVRNSGANLLVEGIGDHGCEYMTAGKVIILGQIGRNFAAGMSGGFAFIYQTKEKIQDLCNITTIDLEDVVEKEDQLYLKNELEHHFQSTQSQQAKQILHNFEAELKNFTKVFPKEYKQVLKTQKK